MLGFPYRLKGPGGCSAEGILGNARTILMWTKILGAGIQNLFFRRKRNRYSHSNCESKFMLVFAHQALNKKYFMRNKIPWIFATELLMQC